MLSRVAERMYWLGRYLNRVENSARLINVNTNLLFDLPRDSKLVWVDLTDILDNRDLFLSLYDNDSERNVMKFMLADKDNPSSLINSLTMARENTRTTREILPSETWEQVNAMYLFAKDKLSNALSRGGRYDYLANIIRYSQQITGLLESCMSHDQAFYFFLIGRNLENADMASRIIDVGTANLFSADDSRDYEMALWVNILRSLSAFQMYRQHVPNKVNGIQVVSFLFNDERFPRSILFSLERLERCFSVLPRNETPMRLLLHIKRYLSELNIEKKFDDQLHSFIDEIQLKFNELDEQITETWFQLSDESLMQTQDQTASSQSQS